MVINGRTDALDCWKHYRGIVNRLHLDRKSQSRKAMRKYAWHYAVTRGWTIVNVKH
jgi:hypothetical protein